MRVLVTGGAGFIGSHTVVALAATGAEVVIADDFSNAKRSVIPRLAELIGREPEVHEVDLTDEAATLALLRRVDVDSIIHFAGYKAVGESVAKPLEYYRNNLGSTLSLLAAMRETGVRKLVFSSSATVYGEFAPVPYVESFEPLSATNPYGQTKVMIEQILRDVAAADDDLRIAILRYFNPVGAHPSGRIGEDPQGIPNNLLPYIAQVAVGRRERLSVFGGDYPTADGTCERDYIHVCDLADAHLAALEHLDAMTTPIDVWNIGSGTPTSVLQMVEAFGKATGHPIPYVVDERRAGDLAQSWADAGKANAELGWHTTKTIDDMCADAWRWQQANPQGFPD